MITCLKTEQDNEYLMYRTLKTDKGIILELSITDDNLKKPMYAKRYYLESYDSEKTFHDELRAEEKERFIQNLSTAD